MMKAKEFLEKTYQEEDEYVVRPRAICKDGFSVSIQGGTFFHYCSPRRLCNFYNEVELGFPSQKLNTLKGYAEDKNHCKTVFGYVPIKKVEDIIKRHGGIDYEKSLGDEK